MPPRNSVKLVSRSVDCALLLPLILVVLFGWIALCLELVAVAVAEFEYRCVCLRTRFGREGKQSLGWIAISCCSTAEISA